MAVRFCARPQASVSVGSSKNLAVVLARCANATGRGGLILAVGFRSELELFPDDLDPGWRFDTDADSPLTHADNRDRDIVTYENPLTNFSR